MQSIRWTPFVIKHSGQSPLLQMRNLKINFMIKTAVHCKHLQVDCCVLDQSQIIHSLRVSLWRACHETLIMNIAILLDLLCVLCFCFCKTNEWQVDEYDIHLHGDFFMKSTKPCRHTRAHQPTHTQKTRTHFVTLFNCQKHVQLSTMIINIWRKEYNSDDARFNFIFLFIRIQNDYFSTSTSDVNDQCLSSYPAIYYPRELFQFNASWPTVTHTKCISLINLLSLVFLFCWIPLGYSYHHLERWSIVES